MFVFFSRSSFSSKRISEQKKNYEKKEEKRKSFPNLSLLPSHTQTLQMLRVRG